MAKIKSKFSKTVRKNVDSPFKNYWDNTNYFIFGAGIVILIIGFFLLSQGPWDNPVSLSVAPLVLLLAYLIIFPVAIFYKKKNKTSQN